MWIWIFVALLGGTLQAEDEVAAIVSERFGGYPKVPFEHYIYATGIVEASSENISIGIPMNRLVEQVYVKVGDSIKRGQPLLRLQNSDLKADLAVSEAQLKITQAKLKKLEAMPQDEDIAHARAALEEARAGLQEARSQYERVKGLCSGAMSAEEIDRRKFAYREALSRGKEMEASLKKVEAGTWGPDLEIAKLEVELSHAQMRRQQDELRRTVMRSPIEGKVLQVKIREGEMPPQINPAMIIGDTHTLYLKVSINQYDAGRYRKGAEALAFTQGEKREEFPLEFVRLEPYLVEKTYASNAITEKVDTKVLNVIYRFKNEPQGLFVGQQMDVFIDAKGE